MEDSGLSLLLKNGYRSQWEREETMAVGGTVKKCLWELLSKARQRVKRTVRALCVLSACQTAWSPLPLLLHSPFKSVFLSCTGSFLAMSKPY